MKKILTLLLSLILVLGLFACGGGLDTAEYEKARDEFLEEYEIIIEALEENDLVPDDVKALFVDMEAVLNEFDEQLEDNTTITQEQLDAQTEALKEARDQLIELKPVLSI